MITAQQRPVSRRHFLGVLGALTLGAAALAACGNTATATTGAASGGAGGEVPNGTYGGSISQTFATVAGGAYTLNYWVGEQQGDDPGQILRATITSGAQTLTQDTTPTGSWAEATISFVASGSTATVTFLDATPAGGGGGIVSR